MAEKAVDALERKASKKAHRSKEKSSKKDSHKKRAGASETNVSGNVAEPVAPAPRRTTRHRSVQKSLAQESLFGVGISILEEYALFTNLEVGEFVKKYEHHRSLANRISFDKAVDADILENWMEWLCLQMEVYDECCRRVNTWTTENKKKLRVERDAPAEQGLTQVAAQLSIARGYLKRSLVKNLRALHRKFPTDRRIDFTVLDLYLRLGAVNAFDEYISSLVLRYPAERSYWYLAIRRRIAAGDYLGSLALCQKALRYHAADKELDKCLRNLTLVLAAVALAAPEEEVGVAGPGESSDEVSVE